MINTRSFLNSEFGISIALFGPKQQVDLLVARDLRHYRIRKDQRLSDAKEAQNDGYPKPNLVELLIWLDIMN